MATASDRLPGIRFEAVRPPAATALPRMDIAAFAGFAASGPVGLPLAVEDVVRFGDIFGGDLRLAWDPAAGAAAYAHMPVAVREFFRNGGRRCWVVRLADDAETAEVRLPGLLRSRNGTVTGAASAIASSPGSWSDDLTVNATLLRTPLGDGTFRVEQGTAPGVRLLRPDTPDLLRLELPDGVIGFMPPAPVSTAADRSRAERDAEMLRPAALASWFRRALPDALPKRSGARLDLLAGAAVRRLTIRSWNTGTTARFRVAAAEVADVQPGAWLRLTMDEPAGSRFGTETFLIVEDVQRDGEFVALTSVAGWRTLQRQRAWTWASTRPMQASLVAAELWARRAGAGTLRVADVGLTPAHPRWLGHFPDDATLFASAATLVQGPAATLWTELSRPRFPIAAPRDATAAAEVLLPLGLETLPRADYEQRALTSARSPLERDGLATLGSGTFLDPALRTASTETLLETAFDVQYAAPVTRRLTGIHALLPVEEASLLAVPDAVQRGFIRTDGSGRTPPAPPRAPAIVLVSSRDGAGQVYVDWTSVRGTTTYVLEHGTHPRFEGATRVLRTAASSAEVPLDAACADRTYFRVRAETPTGNSPWSNSWLVEPAPDVFDVCGRTALRGPDLKPMMVSGGKLQLEWRRSGTRYRVERAADPLFSAPETVYEGPRRRTELWLPEQPAFFRVTSWNEAEESPWSRTAAFLPAAPFRWEVRPATGTAGAEAEARLEQLHEAMLRMCAARADIFAVLSLPPHYREAQALAHAAVLTARLGTGSVHSGDAGGRVLSYGALYHPWPVVAAPGAGERVRATPPDGPMTGLIAARTLEGGAWSAPANRPLAGVVALQPTLAESARGAFFGRRVNALAPSPDGFLVWSEETLSDDAELAGIGVRRLLILLRRLALREGTLHVFQPHNASFRRLVQRQFDGVLGDLFSRGALAGQQPEQGFRVVTSDAVNPVQSVDQGRLVVELRVAPSRPLHFLTVRLVQTGAGLTVGEV